MEIGKVQKMMNLNAKALKNIEDEIEKFESKVDFEFIPVISSQSSYTEHTPWSLSLIFILLFSTVLKVCFDNFFYNSWYDQTFFYLAAVALAIVLSRFLSRSDRIQRWLISKKERARQVHEKAQMIFFTRRFDEIKSRNALLVYISVMEHRIEIIPDPQVKMEGLNAMTSQSVAILRDAFKKKHYEQGFISLIQYLQSQLLEKFPRQNKGENVVSNKLIFY